LVQHLRSSSSRGKKNIIKHKCVFCKTRICGINGGLRVSRHPKT